MTRPYAREMAKLAETFAWAAAADLQPLREVVRTAGLSPLRAIGSGGSLTGAAEVASRTVIGRLVRLDGMQSPGLNPFFAS